jgi:hypothetical protein
MNRDNAVQRDIDHVPNTGVEVPAYRKKHLRNRIEGLLNASSPQPLSPKIIALRLGANHSAVKKAVQREMNSPNPRFYRVGRGLYQGTAAQNETVPISQVETLGFHAIKLEARCPQVGIAPAQLSLYKSRESSTITGAEQPPRSSGVGS